MPFFEATIALDCAVFAIAFSVVVLLVKQRNSKLPYPPGPKGLPLIGNILDVPSTHQWLTYARWAREFNSDVLRLNLAGTNVIVVNSQSAAFELFDKRSNIYSDRPRLPMIVELTKWDWAITFIKYGPKWRSYRKLFHKHFHTGVVEQYYPQEIKATHELLHRLAVEPERFKNHIQLMAASMILNLTYGINVQSFDDPFVENVEKTMEALTEAGVPGAFLVDALPILKYVPSWMPGAGFQVKAKRWRKAAKDTADIPLQYVKDEMAKGTHVPSVTSRCLEDLKEDPKDEAEAEEVVRGVTAVVYAGGSDTTTSAISTMLLAMIMHPEVLRKAQQQLDEVLGDRLPDFSDRPSLPYIEAILREVLRWQPVVPGGFPHLLTTDDVYNGMFLPKGSVVVGNTWAILNDERTYGHDVQQFNPERFLKDGELNLNVRYPDAAFGYGRRICPGRHLAEDSMFITFASVLATFNISKAIDENGNPVTPVLYYSTGTISHPTPFQCSIKPRSQRALNLINEANRVHHP